MQRQGTRIRLRRCAAPADRVVAMGFGPKQEGLVMAKAFFYHGLTIEFDAHIPRLTIDGEKLPLPSQSPTASGPTLLQQAKDYVNGSCDLSERDSIRDSHVARLREGSTRWNDWRRQSP